MTTLSFDLDESDIERIATRVAAKLAAARGTPAPAGRSVELLTVAEAALILKCSQRWVRHLLASGRLRGTRTGTTQRARVRIQRADVERLIDASTS